MLYKLFSPEAVTVTQVIPSSANAGSDFTVEVTITKGTLAGFAKLQQELPAGLTATNIESKGASFTFSNQTIKLIWTSLPAESEFKISYKVVVDPGASGEKSIAGKFSYIVDNVKASVEIPVSVIDIKLNSSTATIPPPAVTNTEVTSTPPPSPPATSESPKSAAIVNCSRNVPGEVEKEFTVELTIHKENVSGFAKLQETLPDGFSATSVENKGASFTFTEQKVKFVWVSLPEENEFKISYKVKINDNVAGTQSIDGIFSYIENDETKKFLIGPSSISVKDAIAKEPEVAKNVEEKKAAPQEKIKNDQTASAGKTKTPIIPITKVPSMQTGIQYRVQIAALHNNLNTNYFKTKFDITEEIYSEMHEGWNKHTVGAFDKYKSARDHREEIKTKGIEGPFVCAYNTGQRITVQEALMITNQKWYK